MALTTSRPRTSTSAPAPPKRPILTASAIAVFGLALLALTHLVGARRDLLVAGNDLRASRQALTKRDDAGATAILDRAGRQLSGASSSASAFPLGLLRGIPLVGSPVRAAATAARAGREGVAAARGLVAASSSFPTSASAAVDGHDLSDFHAAATRSQAAVADADLRLARADSLLSGPSGAVLPPVSGPARAMRTELAKSRTELAAVGRGMSLLGDLTSPATDARLLLLSQDSLELRPTGGYVGSYGVIHFSHGTVTLEKYAATEDLPPAVPPVAAPFDLAKHLPGAWGLSNVNWWPDFPTTAAAAGEMFRRQGGGDVDGVLALTELATARLVGALGPVKLPSYAQPVTEVGFDQRVVQEVELKRPLDQPRKKFLVELSTAVFDDVFHLPAAKLPAVTDAIRRSIGAGDLQLWFTDPARQQALTGTVVAGQLPRPAGDMLMVVDANMTASKANLALHKSVDYKVARDPQGRLVAHLRVEIRNDGPKSSINPVYNSFLQVYAPEGARLLDPAGPQAAQPAADGPFEVFSQDVSVDPGATAVATFDYVLPDSVATGGQYRLTWIRQAGTPDDRLRVDAAGRSAQFGAGNRSLQFDGRLAK
jgi:hypothetical protein